MGRVLIAEAGCVPEARFSKIVQANGSTPSGFCSTNNPRQVLEGREEKSDLCHVKLWPCRAFAFLNKKSCAECACQLVTLLTPSWPGQERLQSLAPEFKSSLVIKSGERLLQPPLWSASL